MTTATHDPIALALERLPAGPLTESGVTGHIRPLFSRVLRRPGIYLANHSLGRPPDRMAEDVRTALDLWYADMDGAWEGWMGQMARFRAGIAALIGCGRADAVVPKSAAGQGLRAVLNALPSPCPSVLTTQGEFDSIDHTLRTYEARGRATVRRVPADDRDLFHADLLIDRLDERTDLVVVSQVVFATGQVLTGLDRLIEAAHEVGALVLIDTYHSAGAMPVGFDALDADFAIGGSYKYTRGGPGACWLAIHPKHLTESPRPALRTLDTGWFAKREPFAFERPEEPLLAPGGDAWMESTPAILPIYQAWAGLELTLGIGVERLRAYNLQQQAFLADRLLQAGARPRLLESRGNFLLVPHADPQGLEHRLRHRGVFVDARRSASGNGFVRLCPDMLSTEGEMGEAARIVGELVG